MSVDVEVSVLLAVILINNIVYLETTLFHIYSGIR